MKEKHDDTMKIATKGCVIILFYLFSGFVTASVDESRQFLATTAALMPQINEWEDWNMNQFREYYDCEQVLSQERPVPDNDTYILLRETYMEVAGSAGSFLDDGGFTVKVKGAQSPGKGRGVFAEQFIPKGTLMYTSRQKAYYPNASSYRKLLMSIPADLACDVTMWTYIQHLSTNDDDKELVLVTELDFGSLVNNGVFPSAEAREEGWEEDQMANMGCIPEFAKKLPGGCQDNYFALSNIDEGEEILCAYQDYVISDWEAWESFGL